MKMCCTTICRNKQTRIFFNVRWYCVLKKCFCVVSMRSAEFMSKSGAKRIFKTIYIKRFWRNRIELRGTRTINISEIRTEFFALLKLLHITKSQNRHVFFSEGVFFFFFFRRNTSKSYLVLVPRDVRGKWFLIIYVSGRGIWLRN